MRRLLVLALGVGLGIDAGAQAPPQGPASRPTGLILGRVVDAATDAPISGVIVGLNGAGQGRGASALTNGDGRFVFRSVPKGTFTLPATIGGNGYAPGGFIISGTAPQIGPYLNGGFGQRRPGGPLQPIDLADGERLEAVIKLWKGASIDGSVVDEAGEPLVDVAVAAAKRSTDGRLLTGPAVRTDDRGAYHIGTLVPGDYVVVVPQVQLLMPVSTADASASNQDRQLTARLASTSAVTGSRGVTVGTSALQTGTFTTTTSLAPSPRGDAFYVYQTTFAPAATSTSQASIVTVKSGEERAGVNIIMQPVRAAAVSGTLSDDIGPVPQFGVRLMPLEAADGSSILDVAFTSTDAQGAFVFPLVPAGSYRVIARRETLVAAPSGPEQAANPPAPTRVSDRLWASAQQEITVGDQDLPGVALQLRQGVQISGHVEFHGSGNRPAADRLKQLSVAIGRTDPLSRTSFNVTQSALLDANLEFVLRNIAPARYLLFSNGVPGWTVESIAIGGRVVTDRAVTIDAAPLADVTVVLTDQPAELSGTVHSRSGALDLNAGVFVFPTDQSRWRDARSTVTSFRAVRVSRTGMFRVTPLLPGDYFVAAMADESAADFPDAKFLAALAPLSKTFRIAAVDKQTVDLTTTEIPVGKTSGSALSIVQAPFSPDLAHGPLVPVVPDVPDVPDVPVVLSGLVTTDEATPHPLRHAVVTATGAEVLGQRQAVTDDDGRFAFADLPPGRYSLVAEKPAYVKTYYGGKRPGRPPGTPFAILANQPAPTVVIRMVHGAAIAGTVRDAFGAPVASSQLAIKQPIVVNGQRRLIDVPNLLIPRATTDDKGRYRIYGLPPGDYTVQCFGGGAGYIGVRETLSADVDLAVREMQAGTASSPSSASPPEARQITMAGGYLPGVPDANGAQIVTLRAGEERADADFVVRLVRTMKVEGLSLAPDGGPMTNVMVAIVNAGDRTMWGSPGLIRPGADGHFVAPPLTPGHYAFVGRASDAGAPASAPALYSGEVDFFVGDADVSGVILQFDRGVAVTGRLVLPGGSTPDDFTRVRLGLTPVDSLASFGPPPPAATIQPDGAFKFDGISAGKWRMTGSLPGGWSLRSAMLDGKDTLDVPFDVGRGQAVSGLVVMAIDRPTEISGTLRDASGQLTSEYSMVAFSTDRSLWTGAPRRVSSAVRLSSDGRYRVTGLPPGEYYLSAIADFDPVQIGDPAFLESLISQSIKVTLGEGERKLQDLKIGG
jgi:protocatechuate 3,4-dioxygenase beta subunit